MMSPDIFNALLEFLGGVFTFQNALRVCRDRGYAGITWTAVAFFATWSAWNTWYYPSLDQTWSWVAAIFMLTANLCWIAVMAWFGPIRRETLND